MRIVNILGQDIKKELIIEGDVYLEIYDDETVLKKLKR